MQLILLGSTSDTTVFHTFAPPCKGFLRMTRMTVQSVSDEAWWYFGKDLTIGTGLFPLANEEEAFIPDLNRNGIHIPVILNIGGFQTKIKSGKIFFDKGERVALIAEKQNGIDFFLVIAEFVPAKGEVIKSRRKGTFTSDPALVRTAFSIGILTDGWMKSVRMRFLGEEQSDDIGILWAVLFSAGFGMDAALHSSFANIAGEGDDLTPSTGALISGAEHLHSLPFAFLATIPEVFETFKEFDRQSGGSGGRVRAGDWIGVLQEAIQGVATTVTFMMEVEYYVSKSFPKYIGDWISGSGILDMNKMELGAI